MAIAGKTFVFTGTLKVPRHEAQQIVEELGGIAGHSVTRATDYLVCGEDQVGKSSKWFTAGLLGVTRVDEDFFWQMVEEERKEDWSNVKGYVTEETLLRVLNYLEEKRNRKTPINVPKLENPTWKWTDLSSWTGPPPKLGKNTCPYCNTVTPYSIESNYWWCFNCYHYYNEKTEVKHVCSGSWEEYLKIDNGAYLRCKVCGNVIFESNEEFAAKVDGITNYVHSLEFAAEVSARYVDIDRKRAEAVGRLISDPKLVEEFKAYLERKQKLTA